MSIFTGEVSGFASPKYLSLHIMKYPGVARN